MTTIPGVDAGALRHLYAAPGPIASVYLDLRATAEEDAPHRWRPLATRLERDGAGPTTIAALAERLLDAAPGPGTLAAFAGPDEVLLTVAMSDAEQPDLAVFGSLPHVLPVLGWLHEHPALVVVVADRAGADVLTYARGTTEPAVTVVTGPDDEIERNAPGGWSQPRYQRRAEDSWAHNAASVADAVGRALRQVDAHLLLLAGDVRALQYLDDHLPAWVRHEVAVRRISGGRSQDGSWPRRAEQVRDEARLAAEEDRASWCAELAEGRGPGGLSVEGVRETLEALAAGRVRALLVSTGVDPERVAWFGAGPTDVADRPEPLVRTGGPVQRAPLVDVAVRAAVLTGADVRVLDAGRGDGPVAGIGALCRFSA